MFEVLQSLPPGIVMQGDCILFIRIWQPIAFVSITSGAFPMQAAGDSDKKIHEIFRLKSTLRIRGGNPYHQG